MDEYPVPDEIIQAMDDAWNGGTFRSAAAEVYRAAREADHLVKLERALLAAAEAWSDAKYSQEAAIDLEYEVMWLRAARAAVRRSE